MIKKSDSAAGERSVAAEPHSLEFTPPTGGDGHSRRSGLWGLGVAALLAGLALCLFGGGRSARSQVPPLQIIGLAQVRSDNSAKLEVDGPTDLLQTEIIFQPGAETGWHYHPGPVVAMVKSGAVTMIHSNGCTTVYAAGSGFFELKDVIHNVVNQTGSVADLYATFLSPAGTQPLIPASNPGRVCHGEHHDH